MTVREKEKKWMPIKDSRSSADYPVGCSGEPAVCTQDTVTLSLATCLLSEHHIDYSLLSLNDQNCIGHLNQESHMVEFHFNMTNNCGSEVTVGSPLHSVLSYTVTRGSHYVGDLTCSFHIM